jgi:adenylosuccinate lyase
MHAEVTSFGLKWALYYDELKRDLRRLELARKDIEVVKISGAVGNFSVVPPMVEEYVASILDLGYADISTQVLSRDRHANYIFAISQIASTIEKIATEVRHLSRSEVHEVEENFSDGQKGSSAMPHKRNPIASENMCGCARILRSYVNVSLENNILWHERDISHSSAERIMLADATTLIDYMLVRYTSVIRDLVVFPKRMMDNINLNFNIVFSGRVLSVLIDRGLSREEAYDLIQPLTFRAYDEQIDFRKLLKTSKVRGILDEQEIDDCFSVDYYLRNVEYIYERVGVKNE